MPARLSITAVLVLAATGAAATDLAELGEAFFFDTNLSLNRTQSCATCHNPATAFTDSRDNGIGGAVSLGDDGTSLGDRNAPTITYASLSPGFGRDETGVYAGGLFYDGRASGLENQAGQPFTNPLEMNLADNAAVVARVHENPQHVNAMKALFGDDIFEKPDAAFRAITESLAAFERTARFAPFDSKYDRFLRGEAELTAEEEIGRKLFFSQVFNCHTCHVIDARENVPNELFTTHRYHNIGVPVNPAVRELNGLGMAHRDPGLLDHPRIDDAAEAGKFILTNAESQTNPETGEPWGDTEYPDTVDHDLLGEGQPISSLQAGPLVAFLRALTDQRYEHLLAD